MNARTPRRLQDQCLPAPATRFLAGVAGAGPPRRLCSSLSPFASCFTFFFVCYRFVFCGLSEVLDLGGCYDGDKSFDSSLGFFWRSSLPVWSFHQR
ncbi:hypothetical protein HID58_055886 [Brassica napus]|uniref:Uncharacterized protein n=1 Tax=Brassica napus TaxID=3708 RepID=A0ABQ8ALS0_BRANA|nr:hypothetical protein HID58_055886 [Brassica napus]